LPCHVFDLICLQFEWAKTAGAIIERFGGFSTHEVLGEQNLNSPRNAFMASNAPHQEFDRLDMWLTPAKVCSTVLSLVSRIEINYYQDEHGVIPNSYDVTSYRGENWLAMMGTGVMSRITFQPKQVGKEIIPAPDPRIIALHAACAKVAHMSAAAEHLEVVFRDPEQLRVMTDDGAFLNLVGTLSNLMVVSA
jgi:hypothetical protein